MIENEVGAGEIGYLGMVLANIQQGVIGISLEKGQFLENLTDDIVGIVKEIDVFSCLFYINNYFISLNFYILNI